MTLIPLPERHGGTLRMSAIIPFCSGVLQNGLDAAWVDFCYFWDVSLDGYADPFEDDGVEACRRVMHAYDRGADPYAGCMDYGVITQNITRRNFSEHSARFWTRRGRGNAIKS